MQDQEFDRFAKYYKLTDIMSEFLNRQERFEKTEALFGLQFKKAITTLDPEKHASIIEKCQRIFEPEFVTALLTDSGNGKIMEKYAVVCHGDCWNNNMLFKNDKVSLKIKLCAVVCY